MNTQDNIGQADPRFWVIMDYKKVYGFENGYTDNYEMFDIDDANTVSSNLEEIVEYINENFPYEAELIEVPFSQDEIKITWLDNPDNELQTSDLEEIADFLPNHTVIGYQWLSEIQPNTFFITHKEAKEHLERNAHHYSSKAHTYAMTAWRSPEVDRLWKILQKVNWKGVK